MDTTVHYDDLTRKILVVFPGVRPESCEDLEAHKSALLPLHASTKMDLRKLSDIEVGAEEPPNVSTSQLNYPLAPMSQPPATPLQGNSKRPISVTSDQSDETPCVRRQLKWPALVTMGELHSFLVSSNQSKQMTNKQAWDLTFKNRIKYVDSTVTRYRRWIASIKPEILKPYLDQYGHHTVQEGVGEFSREWKAGDRRADYSGPPKKRVKIA